MAEVGAVLNHQDGEEGFSLQMMNNSRYYIIEKWYIVSTMHTHKVFPRS